MTWPPEDPREQARQEFKLGLWLAPTVVIATTVGLAVGVLSITVWPVILLALGFALYMMFVAGRAAERMDWLDRILIRCPATSKLVATTRAEGAAYAHREMTCPECGSLHVWKAVYTAEIHRPWISGR